MIEVGDKDLTGSYVDLYEGRIIFRVKPLPKATRDGVFRGKYAHGGDGKKTRGKTKCVEQLERDWVVERK